MRPYPDNELRNEERARGGVRDEVQGSLHAAQPDAPLLPGPLDLLEGAARLCKADRPPPAEVAVNSEPAVQRVEQEQGVHDETCCVHVVCCLVISRENGSSIFPGIRCAQDFDWH